MTISDAIKHLSYKIAYYKCSVSKHANDVLVEALELAVIALEELKEQQEIPKMQGLSHEPMTNKEAIEILKNLMTMKNISFIHFSQRLAIGMAIDALEDDDVEKLERQMNKVAGNSLEWYIPLDDFLKTIERRFIRESYIVHLKYRYKHELNFTHSVEVLENENGEFIWLNDWDEGQEEVYVVNAVPLADVFEYVGNDRALLKILKEGTK